MASMGWVGVRGKALETLREGVLGWDRLQIRSGR